MRSLVASFACMAAALWNAAAAEEIRTADVFGPETPTGAYKHPACFEELKNGDLYLVYYGGDGEYAEGAAVFGARLEKGAERWTPPVPIATNPFYSLGNAVVWQAPDAIVWLFYVTRYGKTWSDSRIHAKISKDGARTWSESFVLAFEAGTMVRGRPIVLNDGDYLLPIYHETGEDPEYVPPSAESRFLRCDAKKKTWSESGRIRSRTGNIQPAVVQVSDTDLIAYCRRCGNYEPVKDGYLVRSESRDGGRTWSEGKDSAFPNPNSAVDFIKLANGHLLLVYNDSMNDRTPLTGALSLDGGKTFPHRRNIAEGKDDFAYPTAVQARDGKIHVIYTARERTLIRHSVFSEEDILGRKP